LVYLYSALFFIFALAVPLLEMWPTVTIFYWLLLSKQSLSCIHVVVILNLQFNFHIFFKYWRLCVFKYFIVLHEHFQRLLYSTWPSFLCALNSLCFGVSLCSVPYILDLLLWLTGCSSSLGFCCVCRGLERRMTCECIQMEIVSIKS
jgi:hypothetical protein